MREIRVPLEDGSTALMLVSGGPTNLQISVRGRVFNFSFDERWGPLFIGKRGGEIDQQRIPNYAFDAVSIWHRQGENVDNGEAVWKQPTKSPGFAKSWQRRGKNVPRLLMS